MRLRGRGARHFHRPGSERRASFVQPISCANRVLSDDEKHAELAILDALIPTHASRVGALMPTSHNMIIYSLAAGGKVSVGALSAAGLLPSIVLMICMVAAAYLVAVQRGYPAAFFPVEPRSGFRSLLQRRAC